MRLRNQKSQIPGEGVKTRKWRLAWENPGCEGGTIPEPIVSSYNGDSVTLQVVTDVPSSITHYDEILGGSEAQKTHYSLNEMASEICRKGHRKQAELVSSKRITGQYYYIDEFLFLCLNE